MKDRSYGGAAGQSLAGLGHRPAVRPVTAAIQD
jgi:hypothetical protein